jgi:hypothetical protein
MTEVVKLDEQRILCSAGLDAALPLLPCLDVTVFVMKRSSRRVSLSRRK